MGNADDTQADTLIAIGAMADPVVGSSAQP